MPSSSSGGGPLIILFGWLGCKERSLNRYKEMYHQLFCNNPPSSTVTIKTFTPTPSMIVDASIHSMATKIKRKPKPKPKTRTRTMMTKINDDNNSIANKRNIHDEEGTSIQWPSSITDSTTTMTATTTGTLTTIQQQSDESTSTSTIPTTLEELAWSVIEQIYENHFDLSTTNPINIKKLKNDENDNNNNMSLILFHSFSNGGCMLWESLRRVLDESSVIAGSRNYDDGDDNDKEDVTIEEKVGKMNHSSSYDDDDDGNTNKGKQKRRMNSRTMISSYVLNLLRNYGKIIFDSCPGWYDGTKQTTSIRYALQYCSIKERLHILVQQQKYGPGIVLYYDEHVQRMEKDRCYEFFQYLYMDPINMPQLYLYSKNDTLANWKKIDLLINHRRSSSTTSTKQGKQLRTIQSKVWDISGHCSHLLYHPYEYKKEVEIFLHNTKNTDKMSLRSNL